MRMEGLYRLSLEHKQYAVCVAIEKRVAALFGLDAPMQVEVGDKREERVMRDRATADLQARLNALRTNGGARPN